VLGDVRDGSGDVVVTERAQSLGAADLDDRAQLALLHRILHRAGFDDGTIAGHISLRLDDGTLLITPGEWAWDEVRASHLMHIDPDGTILEGDWTVNSAASVLHTVFHRHRPGIKVAVHHHPQWASVWAASHRIPPVYDQLSALVRDDLVLYNDYRGIVTSPEIALENVRALDGTSKALLANHGVFVLAESVPQAHLRSIALEHRCQLAWRVEALGSPGVPVAPEVVARLSDRADADAFIWASNFASAVRRELAADPNVLL